MFRFNFNSWRILFVDQQVQPCSVAHLKRTGPRLRNTECIFTKVHLLLELKFNGVVNAIHAEPILVSGIPRCELHCWSYIHEAYLNLG